jgi:hypothetical protein
VSEGPRRGNAAPWDQAAKESSEQKKRKKEALVGHRRSDLPRMQCDLRSMAKKKADSETMPRPGKVLEGEFLHFGERAAPKQGSRSNARISFESASHDFLCCPMLFSNMEGSCVGYSDTRCLHLDIFLGIYLVICCL